jgi:hypothetical protein
MEAEGLSYHRSEKDNRKWDEVQILARREEIKKLAPRWTEVERGELLILLEDEGHLVWGDPSWTLKLQPL